jgi:hypothetical protein
VSTTVAGIDLPATASSVGELAVPGDWLGTVVWLAMGEMGRQQRPGITVNDAVGDHRKSRSVINESRVRRSSKFAFCDHGMPR